MEVLFVLIVVICAIGFDRWLFERRRKKRLEYCRNEYLKSEEWQSQKSDVLKRDNEICVFCGGKATEVQHKNREIRNTEKESTDILVSVCKSCSDGLDGFQKRNLVFF